jgi:hypothetical protein
MLARLLRRGTFIALLACALAAAGCGSSSHPTQAPARSAPLISIFEAGPQLQSDPAGTLAKLRRLGVQVVKVFVPWERLAGATPPAAGADAADPATYPAAAWAPYDTIVRDASARGLGVDLTVNAPPLWAAGSGAPPGAHPQWKPSASAYGQFMRAVATRYSGTYKPAGAASALPRVRFWSIWNEPNFGPDLAPQAIGHSRIEVSPALYRSLVDAGWSALSATGHGRDTILIGELAPRGQTGGSHPGNFDGMVPLRFLRALYCVDAELKPLAGAPATERGCPARPGDFRSQHPGLFEATGFADHPYGQGRVPPNVPAAGEPDYADFPAIPRLERTLDRIMTAYGSSKRWSIYSTEFGYQTDPPERISYAATPKQAAFFDNWAEYLSWRDPRIASYDQYQLIDPPTAGALGGFATGLLFADGTPKATFAAYRMPLFMPQTAANKNRELEVWGCVRPARASPRPGPVEIQFRAANGTSWTTLRSVSLTDPAGYFDVSQKFPSSGTVRLAWSYPDGQLIHSRKVIITLR